MAALACAACAGPRRAPERVFIAPQGWAVRYSKIDPDVVELIQVAGPLVTQGRTDFVVSGGVTFGNTSTNLVPVSLLNIEVSTVGGPLEMDTVKVYAGSGAPPETPQQANLVAAKTPTGSFKKSITITSFNPTPEPYDTSADDEYWVWVVVEGKDTSALPGAPFKLNSMERYTLVEDHYPSTYSLEW